MNRKEGEKNMEEIEIYRKNVYGIERIYVKDENIAGIFLEITGKKTLDQRTIERLVMLGISFKEVLPR